MYMSAPRLNIYNACVWVFRIVATVGSEAGGGFFAGEAENSYEEAKFTENESRFFLHRNRNKNEVCAEKI